MRQLLTRDQMTCKLTTTSNHTTFNNEQNQYHTVSCTRLKNDKSNKFKQKNNGLISVQNKYDIQQQMIYRLLSLNRHIQNVMGLNMFAGPKPFH